MTECRMLTDEDSPAVLRTMVEGFSEYILKIDIDEDGYRQKFLLDGVEYAASVGVLEDGEMIGVTMNATDDWNGRKTVYDAGTVVVPGMRGKGVSTKMFDYMLPKLAHENYERYLLEVITENTPALKLYRRCGFETVRNFGVFYFKGDGTSPPNGQSFEIRSLELADIESEVMFDDSGLAWQNSNKWIRRSAGSSYKLDYLGIFVDGELAGFGIVSPNSGKVLRLHIAPAHRMKGLGRRILSELDKQTPKQLVFLNVDLADKDAVGFLESTGCVKKVEQFEMELIF